MIPFVKMHGIGNDFVMVDAIGHKLPAGDLPELAVRMNDRRFGIGGDGLILLERGSRAPLRMRMLNPDGSESEMCGNGVRCFALLAKELGYCDSDCLEVETGAGVLELQIREDRQVRVDMGRPRLAIGEIGMAGPTGATFVDQPFEGHVATAVSMGNPHVVIFVEDADGVDLAKVGPSLEHSSLFPNRTNVHFAQALNRSSIRQRTWERGAGATMACGTGACAVAVAGFLTGRTERSVEVRLPGGTLQIEYAESGRVYMTGPAERVFDGEWPTP